MTPRLAAVLALSLALAGPLQAEDSEVLATYHVDNCCLPPEFAWETDVTVFSDGRLVLEHCSEYATEVPGCMTIAGQVTGAGLQAIRAAAVASGLAKTPAGLNPDPLIGGGGTSGSVTLEGMTIELPRDPAPADADRVALVLQAIAAAIPATFEEYLWD